MPDVMQSETESWVGNRLILSPVRPIASAWKQVRISIQEGQDIHPRVVLVFVFGESCQFVE